MDEDLIEKKISSENVYDGKFLHLKKDVALLPNGKKATREWLTHPGASAVVPVTEDNEIILEKQYRYPIQKVTLEIPAGKMDKVGEDPLVCAKRELSEETGFTSDKMTKLTCIATTVGFSNEYIHIYLAQNLVKGEQHTDEDEFINLVKVPFEKAVEMIKDGTIYDAKTICGILYAKTFLSI